MAGGGALKRKFMITGKKQYDWGEVRAEGAVKSKYVKKSSRGIMISAKEEK